MRKVISVNYIVFLRSHFRITFRQNILQLRFYLRLCAIDANVITERISTVIQNSSTVLVNSDNRREGMWFNTTPNAKILDLVARAIHIHLAFPSDDSICKHSCNHFWIVRHFEGHIRLLEKEDETLQDMLDWLTKIERNYGREINVCKLKAIRMLRREYRRELLWETNSEIIFVGKFRYLAMRTAARKSNQRGQECSYQESKQFEFDVEEKVNKILHLEHWSLCIRNMDVKKTEGEGWSALKYGAEDR